MHAKFRGERYYFGGAATARCDIPPPLLSRRAASPASPIDRGARINTHERAAFAPTGEKNWPRAGRARCGEEPSEELREN